SALPSGLLAMAPQCGASPLRGHRPYDRAADDAGRGAHGGRERKEGSEVPRGRQARHEQTWNRRLQRVVEDREAVATCDAVEERSRRQEWHACQIDFVPGRIDHVIDFDVAASIEADAQPTRALRNAGDARFGAGRDGAVPDPGPQPWLQLEPALGPESRI